MALNAYQDIMDRCLQKLGKDASADEIAMCILKERKSYWETPEFDQGIRKFVEVQLGEEHLKLLDKVEEMDTCSQETENVSQTGKVSISAGNNKSSPWFLIVIIGGILLLLFFGKKIFKGK